LSFSRFSIPLLCAQAGLLSWLLMPQAALADVWKVVDANGVIQFTNQPPGSKSELVIESKPSGALAPGWAVRSPVVRMEQEGFR